MLSVFLLSLVMAVVTLIAGWLPFVLPWKIDTTLLSQFGTGIILGSAFLLVVPESYEEIGEGRLKSVAGISVVAGFLAMLAIDVILTRQSEQIADEMKEDSELYVTKPGEIQLANPRTWFAGISFTTLGLTIHAAADGIALGSTAANTDSKLELFVFLSIIVHKGPAALSLTSILLAHKNPPTNAQVKRDLVLFSIAGPIAAIILGGIITLLHFSGGIRIIPGICLAFSGGTFVFVVTHVLEHVRSKGDVQKQLLLIGAGTLLPLAASLIPE